MAEKQANEYSNRNITDDVYERLADQLDTLPNGFPRTESGVEIRLLKKVVEPEGAWLAGQLSRKLESEEEIALRLDLPIEEATERLRGILQQGLLITEKRNDIRYYRLRPFLIGIYEAQLETMDHEMAHLMEQYMMLQGAKGILEPQPALHRVMPARQAIKTELILPYDDVRELLLKAKSFFTRDCICRVEQDMLDSRKCNFPLKNCLAISAAEGAFGANGISQEEALALINKTEEIGLVHTVSNNIKDISYVCNCCGCCCEILRGITQWGIENSVAKANYYAEVDPNACTGCEICIDRCQVGAVSVEGAVAAVDLNRCIGCGLCVTGCLDDAMHLQRRPDAKLVHPPSDFMAWEDARLHNRRLTS
jgi:NAD-dependent dihydropyrimidine dehydrogenase PreA subunit